MDSDEQQSKLFGILILQYGRRELKAVGETLNKLFTLMV